MRSFTNKLSLSLLSLILASCASVPVAVRCPRPVPPQYPQLETQPPTVESDLRTILLGPPSPGLVAPTLK